jgi:hypothetical protein
MVLDFELKRREVEVEGRRFKIRELTLGEVSTILNRSMSMVVDDSGRILPTFNYLEYRLSILEFCLEEPRFDRKSGEKLPSRIAFSLLEECIKLTPHLASLRQSI